MAFNLMDNDIEELLAGSGYEGSDDEDQFDPQTSPDNSSSSSSESDPEDDIPLTNFHWKKKKFNSKQVPAVEPTSEPTLEVKTPAEYFERYFTHDIFEQFALATNQYYMTKNGGKEMKPVCTPGEIKKFFGIHGMLGCFTYPRIKLFWNARYRFDPIADAMTRDRFFLLRVNIHLRDVHGVNAAEEQTKNRLWRVQPLIDAVRGRCLQLPRPVANYSIDKQIIPFGGRCPGLKVVVKNKPRPEDLQNFLITTAAGKVMDFEIYQGQTTYLPDSPKFGMGPGVILRLASSIPEGSFIYFDRYFTSLPLMQELHKRNKEGTGTLTSNRFNTVKTTKYEFKKDAAMKRGEHEEIVNAEENLCIVKWKDNKGVLLTSTAFGSEPLSNVSRWEKKKKEYINVSCPAIVKNYNAFMGGVDICDQMMEAYRTWVKTRKWTVKVMLHLFDLSIVNAWMEYREDCKANNLRQKDISDLLAFRLSISEYLLAGAPRSAGTNEPEFAEMPSTSKYRPKPLPPIDKQVDGYNHWPIFDTLNQPRACRQVGCKSRSRCRCTKCDVYLCLTKDRNCFYHFHTQ